MVALRALSLASNSLSALPPEIGGLGNLEALSLTSNRLSSLPPTIGGMARLKVLALAANRIEFTRKIPLSGDDSAPDASSRMTTLESFAIS